MWGPASEQVNIKEALQLEFNSWWDFQVFKCIQCKQTANVSSWPDHFSPRSMSVCWLIMIHSNTVWPWSRPVRRVLIWSELPDMRTSHFCPSWYWWFVGYAQVSKSLYWDMQSVCAKSKESQNQIFLRNMKTRSCSCGLAEYLLYLAYFHQNETILQGHVVC